MTKILLVEDDKSLREIYGVRLLAEGYDIVSAGDGEEALAMAIKERPQLIVSDVMMPKISGFDMLDILRSTTETKNIKVIMMTALSSEDQRKRGEELGADRYLVKSQVGIEDVVRTVHDVLGDIPTTNSANLFGSNPAPSSAAPRMAASAITRPEMNTSPAPRPVTASANPFQPQVNSMPQPAAQPSPQFAQPQPQPQPITPQASGLPQPTAPFSTPRPGTLGDRVIQPLTAAPSTAPPIDEQLERELSNIVSAVVPPAPAQPPIPPAPAIDPTTQPTNVQPPAVQMPQPEFQAPMTPASNVPQLPPAPDQSA